MNKTKVLNWLQKNTMTLILVLVFAFFACRTGGKILMPQNISNLIAQNAYVFVLATGMLLCILTGGNIDLSVGSVVCFAGAVGAVLMAGGMNMWLAVVIMLAIGLLVGAFQAFCIAYIKVPPFITTLAGQLVFRGLTLMILKGLTISPFPEDYMALTTGFIGTADTRKTIALIVGIIAAVLFIFLQFYNRLNRKKKGYELESIVATLVRTAVIAAAVMWLFWMLSRYRGIPTVMITLAVVLLVYSFITSKTVMGRHLYAIGGNEKAAKLSGINTNRMYFLAYVNMAFLAAVAGIAFSARLNGASPQAGTSFELDAIGSCYIGGASAYGGVGTVGGALIGALIMGVLNNAMSIMGVSQDAQQVVKGLVLLAAVAFDVISKQKIQIPFFSKLFRK